MAQAAGTYDTYQQVGIREDLANVISNIAPEDVPFQSMIGTQKIDNTYTEWQTDDLAAPTVDNALLEGDTYEYSDPSPTVRVGTHTQILRKTALVSKTANAVNTAGREKEMAYQVMKRAKELKRDREKILLNNQASVAGSSTTARKMAGLPAWIETNALRGTGGADGGFQSSTKIVDAATDATAGGMRAFTEVLMKDVLQDSFISGGDGDILMMHPTQKRVFSGFSGISELRTDTGTREQATIVGAADVYRSDWGRVTTLVNRWQRYRDVFVIDKEFVKRGILRGMSSVTPAETSDANRRVLICEETLIVRNEKALGVVADLTS